MNANFAAATTPEALAVDRSSGDVYVLEQSTGKVSRFDSSGNPKNFSAGPGEGTNSIPGFLFFVEPSGANISVLNQPGSPYDGDIFVSSFNSVSIWAPSGAKLGQLTGSGTNNGSFGFTCGVAVDDSTGSVFVSDYFGYIWKYTPNSPSGELTDADYTVTGIQTTGFNPCVSAADGNGHIYASQFSDGPLKRFDASSFTGGTPPGQSGTTVATVSRAVQSDQVAHEVYVSEGSQIAVFDEEGNKVDTISGEEMFSGARGVAVNSSTGHVYVSSKSGNKIAEFGYYLPPYIPIDNPGIANGVKHAGRHSFGDFQVSRDGRYAAFNSVMPLTGYQNLGNSEVFRYDAAGTPSSTAPPARPRWPRAKSNTTSRATGST